MTTPLNILLIGAGQFGRHYLRILKKLASEKKIHFRGVVVKTKESQTKWLHKENIPSWQSLDPELLKNVDMTIIATPPETHCSLVKECLKYAHVLVEKPLAENERDANDLANTAKAKNKVLMVGHIFRFHPAVRRLKEILSPLTSEIETIKGQFINPKADDKGRDISLELLHLYDILDFLLEKEPEIKIGRLRNRLFSASLRYCGNLDANLELGWEGDLKKRNLSFLLKNKKSIFCDLLEWDLETEPLEQQVRAFLDAVENRQQDIPNAEVGARIVKIASTIAKIPRAKKPKVAIIGAGLFGANCAMELDPYCDVVLFEKNDGILQEASFINQYRHHWGYHYPRSRETVQDIKRATQGFEKRYGDALLRNFPTFYCVAKESSRVSADDFIQFCKESNLPFTLEFPDPRYVNGSMIAASLKTDEPIYNFPKLYKLVQSYLAQCHNVEVRLQSEVIHGAIEKDGTKRLVIQDENRIYEEPFDYVVNVTYAHLNRFMNWLGFPIKPLRIDLVEALIVRLPIPKMSFAIMDGPFTNLVPTSEDHTFTLVHIKYSNLRREVPPDGLIPKEWHFYSSNREKILKESEKWLPILNRAEVIESRYVFRGVNAYREHDDARPSDIIPHGFGCWSILGGKIINCVLTSQKLCREIYG